MSYTPPAALQAGPHAHQVADVSGLQGTLDGKATLGDLSTLAAACQAGLDLKADAGHAHTISGITGLQAALDGKAGTTHSHAVGDTSGLQAALDGKAATSHTHAIGDTTGLQAALDGKAAAAHAHAIADVTGLQAGLDGKAATSHGHAIADTTGLQAALDAKAAASHTHTASQITDFATAVDARISAASLQARDAGLTSLAGLSAAGLYYLSANDTWSPVTIGSGLSFTNGTLAAIGGGADPFIAKLKLASDVSTGANVTPVNLTGMVFTFEANSTYQIDIAAIVQAPAATTGHGFGMDTSVAVTAMALTTSHQLANTGTLSGGSAIADAAIVGVSSGVPAANTNVPVFGGGLLITGAQGGTCQFIFRSETTAVATCKAGSVIRVMKIA
jgi:hypothetical protein